jgi:HK97 family phage prohead protease
MKTATTPERRTRLLNIVQSRAMDDGTHEITIAANNVARDEFDLDLGSLRLDNYLRNPVILWAHDRRGIPIGRTLEMGRTDDGGIRARFEFLPDDRFAERVRNAWDHGFIRAASVSWGGGQIDVDTGRMRERNAELYEWSLVSVPADPDALRTAERALNVPDGMLGQPLPDDAVTRLEQRVAQLEAAIAAGREPAPATGPDGDGAIPEEIKADLERLLAAVKE